MKYLRLRYDNEDDVEYDMIVIFERDYKEEKIEKVMRDLWNSNKKCNIVNYLMLNGFKVKDVIYSFNDIEVMYYK